jgi:hypothetical protein
MDSPIFKLIKAAYSTLLRPLVAEKVADSTSKIDDFVLSLLDKLFDYESNK